MNYMPKDIYDYIVEKDLEVPFLNAVTIHKDGYSIGEITDRELVREGAVCRLKSGSYHLNLEIQDDEIITAICNGIYVSAFISRHGDAYQVHFLVHPYPINMKPQFEEEITKEVIRYMILKTIVALRLDTPEKVDQYIGK